MFCFHIANVMLPQGTVSFKCQLFVCITNKKPRGNFPGEHHMVWIGKIKPTSKKSLQKTVSILLDTLIFSIIGPHKRGDLQWAIGRWIKIHSKKNENRVGGGEQHIIILQPAKQELFTLSQTLLTACFQLLHNSFFLTTFYQFKALQLLL